MPNKFDASDIKKLKLLFTVVDRNKGEFYLDVKHTTTPYCRERRPRRSDRRRRQFGTAFGYGAAHRTRRNAGDGVPYELPIRSVQSWKTVCSAKSPPV